MFQIAGTARRLVDENLRRFEMDFDQMFMFRPLLEMSAYQTPIKNLYLTGASTHPGGVFAASSYNTTQVILKDVKEKWFQSTKMRHFALKFNIKL